MSALDLRPYYGKAHFNVGRLFWDQGQYENAYRSFKKCCLEADFDNEAGFQAYALAAMKLGKFKEAIEIFDKTLTFNPYSPDHRFNRANCFYYLNEFNTALGIYQELVREYPNEARYWFNLGEAHTMLQQPIQALEAYKQAMRFKTFIGGVGLRIAYCLDKIDKRREACIFLQEYIKRGPPMDQRMSAKEMLKQLMIN
jgi:tetratricopeptide (TPR) repeat protein